MKNTSDPSVHRAREQQLVEHVVSLLNDPRLRLDTVNGNRAITSMKWYAPNRFNRDTDVHRVMAEMNVNDRRKRDRMPLGEQVDVTFWQRKMLLFKRVVARMRVMCVSPTRSLVAGEEPKPMSEAGHHQGAGRSAAGPGRRADDGRAAFDVGLYDRGPRDGEPQARSDAGAGRAE